MEGIERMLEVLRQMKRAQERWTEILAPDKPAMTDVIDWAHQMLGRYANACRT